VPAIDRAAAPGYPPAAAGCLRAAAGYPITLDLTGRRALVVGGGPVAARRARGLLAAGAVVDVVSPAIGAELHALVGGGEVRWLPREFQVTDLREPSPAWFVQTATGVPAVDALVAEGCDALHIWCVRADDASVSAAWTPAVSRGPVGTAAEGMTVAVTGGGDPRRAAALRDAIDSAVTTGLLPVRRVRPDLPSAAGRTGPRPCTAPPTACPSRSCPV